MLDPQHQLLFAVNTETLAENQQDCQVGTITSFLVRPDGKLTFADKVSSGGLFPNSLAVRAENNGRNGATSTIDPLYVYVLNAGGPGSVSPCGISPNITGFTVDISGKMSHIPGAVQSILDPGPLDGNGYGENCPVGGFPVPDYNCGRNPPAFVRAPARVLFTPDGRQLVVTVKGTNSIYVFPVGEDGTPMITQAHGPALPTYFGFTFDHQGHLLVAEVFGQAESIPAVNAGAVSSFTITNTGALQPISQSVGDNGYATCWIALEPVTGQYAYVSNNASNTLSSSRLRRPGVWRCCRQSQRAPTGPTICQLSATAMPATSMCPTAAAVRSRLFRSTGRAAP